MEQNELMHYGVAGMKWGVRHQQKRLAKATTSEQRDKVVNKLNAHKAKATKKIEKLDKQHKRLQKDYEANIVSTDVKAREYANKAAYYDAKRYGRFVSKNKRDKYAYEAGKYRAKAEELKALSEKTKANLLRNEQMTEFYKQGLKDIDSTLIEAGKKRFKKTK